MKSNGPNHSASTHDLHFNGPDHVSTAPTMSHRPHYPHYNGPNHVSSAPTRFYPYCPTPNSIEKAYANDQLLEN